MRPIDHFLRQLVRLPNVGGRGWKFACPLGEGDRDHVLTAHIGHDGRRLVIQCQFGCETPAVLRAMNLRFSDLLPPRQIGHGRRGPAMSDEVRLRRAGLTDDDVQKVLARARARA